MSVSPMTQLPSLQEVLPEFLARSDSSMASTPRSYAGTEFEAAAAASYNDPDQLYSYAALPQKSFSVSSASSSSSASSASSLYYAGDEYRFKELYSKPFAYSPPPVFYDPSYQQPYMPVSDDMVARQIRDDRRHQHKKRRGNLPKHVTDLLRAWLNAHVHHPYPTEDEKAMLMQQTGLSMNQISNWFINARRRRLPSLTKDIAKDIKR